MKQPSYRDLSEQIGYLEEMRDALVEQEARRMFPNYDSLPQHDYSGEGEDWTQGDCRAAAEEVLAG